MCLTFFIFIFRAVICNEISKDGAICKDVTVPFQDFVKHLDEKHKSPKYTTNSPSPYSGYYTMKMGTESKYSYLSTAQKNLEMFEILVQFTSIFVTL